MHVILTLLAGIGVLLAVVLVPFFLGLPFMRMLQRREVDFEPEISWLIGAGIIFFFVLAYAIGSLIV